MLHLRTGVSHYFETYEVSPRYVVHVQVVVRSGERANTSLLNNVTVNAGTPSLLLTNLSSGITYTVEVAAATRAGLGPYTDPATLRLDTASRQLYRDSQHKYTSYFILNTNLQYYLLIDITPWLVFTLANPHIQLQIPLSLKRLALASTQSYPYKQNYFQKYLTDLQNNFDGGINDIKEEVSGLISF